MSRTRKPTSRSVPTIHTTWEALVAASQRRPSDPPAPTCSVWCVNLDYAIWRGTCLLEAEMRLWSARSQTGRGDQWWRAGDPMAFEVRS